MAVVRITKGLSDDIIRIASNKFTDVIKKAEDSRPGHHWGDIIYDKVFGEYADALAKLPLGVMDTTSKMTIQYVCGISTSLVFELSTTRHWPRTIPDSVPAERAYYGGVLILKDDLMWSELHAEVSAWRQRVDQARQRREDFLTGVRKVLSEFSTLAPALKAWPPLWELVPEYAKNKHKEVVVRDKKTKPEIDTTTLGKLTGAMTAVKLGGL